jgi:enamine deaminase RidA (YjgF/YER057c/UK114 family)
VLEASYTRCADRVIACGCIQTPWLGYRHRTIDPATGAAPADGSPEARPLMDAMPHTVMTAGVEMDELVAVTVFSTDVSRDETCDAIYRTYFHGHYPARGFVGTSTPQHGAQFGVLGVAVKLPHLPL